MSKTLLVLGALQATFACTPHFEVFTAKDFGVLEDSYPYDFRATTPEGLVIAVRELEYKKSQGGLDFWGKAVENELRLDRGYALLDKKSVKTKKGLEGTQLRFGIDREEEAHEYIVTVFVVPRQKKMRLYILEAGGRQELVQVHRGQIDWTVSEFVAR